MTKDDDLKGFEELFAEEAQKNRLKSKKREVNNSIENINFLNNNQKRLEKAIDLLDSKINNKQNFEQMHTYLEKQAEENRQHRVELYRMLNLKNSHYRQFMSQIFDFHFKKNN